MMFSLMAAMPDYTPPGISMAREEVSGVFELGVMVFGVPVGSPGRPMSPTSFCLHNWGKTSPVGITSMLIWYNCGQLMSL